MVTCGHTQVLAFRGKKGVGGGRGEKVRRAYYHLMYIIYGCNILKKGGGGGEGSIPQNMIIHDIT